MLSQATVSATLPVADLDRAKRWYQEKLGMTPTSEESDGLLYETAGGAGFMLFPTPIAERAGHTQMGMQVSDVRAEAADLRSRGVVFEEYDQPGLKTVDGLVEMGGLLGGWFKDSEGNLIALIQRR